MTAFRAINGIGLGIVQPLLFSLVADKSSVYGRGKAPSVDGSSTKNGWSKPVDEKNRPNWLTFFCETSFFAEFVGFSVFCQAFGFLLSTGSLGQTAFTAFATSVAPLQIGPMAGWQFALHLGVNLAIISTTQNMIESNTTMHFQIFSCPLYCAFVTGSVWTFSWVRLEDYRISTNHSGLWAVAYNVLTDSLCSPQDRNCDSQCIGWCTSGPFRHWHPAGWAAQYAADCHSGDTQAGKLDSQVTIWNDFMSSRFFLGGGQNFHLFTCIVCIKCLVEIEEMEIWTD